MTNPRSRRIRVAHVQPMTLDLYGQRDEELGRGVRYSVTNLAVAQARAGDMPTIHLLTPHRAHSVQFDGVPAYFHHCLQPYRIAGPRRRFGRQVSCSLLRALSRSTTDVVHFHGIRQFHLMFAAIAWRAGRLGLPLVAQERGFRNVNRLERAAQGFGLKRSDFVYAASEEGLRRLQELGVRGERAGICPNGVDPTIFYPAPGREPRPTAPLRVLLVARLSPEKDPFVLAEGLCELVRRDFPVEVTIVSEGPLRGELESRLRVDRVPATFYGHIPQEDLASHYRAADVLVATSREGEGWTQAVVEAMASGLPVIASDVPGIRDAVGGAGLLVPPGQPTAIAEALTALRRNPALWRALRRDGLRRASEFTWDRIAERLRETYKLVTSRVSASWLVS